MDKEFPRSEGCFTARDQLIRAVCMERLVRDNKARDSPFRALLEMLIYERLQKKSVKSKHDSKVNLMPNAGDSGSHVEMNIRNNNTYVPVTTKETKSESSDSLSSLEGALPVRTVADTDRPQSARGRREPGGFIVRRPPRNDIESVHRLISKSQQYRGPTRVTNSAIQRMEEALKHEAGVHDGEGDRIDADHLLEKLGAQLPNLTKVTPSEPKCTAVGVNKKEIELCVQAYMIKELLWPEGGLQDADPSGFEVDVPRRNAALARALAFILWQAGDSNKAIVANPTGFNIAQTDGVLPNDGIIETLTLSTFTSKAALQEYYSSCVFKEVVNLLLVGKAVTNVFDNKLCFGNEETTVLRGITSRSNIGLLSLYEHYKSCKVGSYYKDPKYPIWIVLNPTAGISNEDVVMTPPLELCIRTRWQGASVSWNSAEPEL
ncbi:hypothetical protein HPB50_020954 [Hyalomma asiaticum]|uniref:Uncharacterized protein n=1 Tax=Hyalomma asiaticum TaxID=266040 RepID=A0ACB7SXW4_HYAAI|nr:hypothetical protein HPB50_020954 [Hyalomma asiaticum]